MTDSLYGSGCQFTRPHLVLPVDEWVLSWLEVLVNGVRPGSGFYLALAFVSSMDQLDRNLGNTVQDFSLGFRSGMICSVSGVLYPCTSNLHKRGWGSG